MKIANSWVELMCGTVFLALICIGALIQWDGRQTCDKQEDFIVAYMSCVNDPSCTFTVGDREEFRLTQARYRMYCVRGEE